MHVQRNTSTTHTSTYRETYRNEHQYYTHDPGLHRLYRCCARSTRSRYYVVVAYRETYRNEHQYYTHYQARTLKRYRT